jgi:hypothetical protein
MPQTIIPFWGILSVGGSGRVSRGKKILIIRQRKMEIIFQRNPLPDCPILGYINWHNAVSVERHGHVDSERRYNNKRITVLPHIRENWHRIRSGRDHGVTPSMSESSVNMDALCQNDHPSVSNVSSPEFNPSRLNDIELARQLLEAARRISLTRPNSGKSN